MSLYILLNFWLELALLFPSSIKHNILYDIYIQKVSLFMNDD